MYEKGKKCLPLVRTEECGYYVMSRVVMLSLSCDEAPAYCLVVPVPPKALCRMRRVSTLSFLIVGLGTEEGGSFDHLSR